MKPIIVILANYAYTNEANVGACCVSSNQHHQGCIIHSSYADVSAQICKAACDNDAQCKGYSLSIVNGGTFCLLATNMSNCPFKWTPFDGVFGDLILNGGCGSSYSGCYVKPIGTI